MALDDALAAGQAAQRDRLTGQVSLFDSGADATVLERPLPDNISEAPPRERLRWEKELLGLYLSDHPLGELAGVIGEYVTAYSGELGEELDQQRICVGGVVTEVRKVVTKSRATMGVATLEDLQGTIEVIVFPKVYDQTEPTWAEDAILFVAGRVDHKGEETVLLADAVWTWEEAQAMGSAEFTRQLGRMDRGRRPMRPVAGNGNGNGNGGYSNGSGNGYANGPGSGAGRNVPEEPVVAGSVRTIPIVSPLRGGEISGTLEVRIGGAPGGAPRVAVATGQPEMSAADDEPPFPDDVVATVVAAQEEPTLPMEASSDQALHVHFERGSQDQVVQAFGTLRAIIHERPGETHVVLHVPTADGRMQRMDLRVGVAYDSELLSMIERRVGRRAVELKLAPQ